MLSLKFQYLPSKCVKNVYFYVQFNLLLIYIGKVNDQCEHQHFDTKLTTGNKKKTKTKKTVSVKNLYYIKTAN